MLGLRFVGVDDTLVGQEDKKSGLLLLPGDVAEDWMQTISSIVKDRITAVPKMACIEIFCSLESRKQTHDYLANIIMNEAAEAINELVLDAVSYANLNVTCICLC